MRFHYISPSVLPSRTANSVHVVLQCEGLARAGAQVTLYAKRSVSEEKDLLPALGDAYGVNISDMRLVSYYSAISRADTLRIAALALATMRRGRRPDAILSRNLYAAFYLAVVQRQPLMFETHQLEQGLRKAMQRTLMTCPWVTTVAVSARLVDFLASHHNVAPRNPIVLHDAAREGIVPLPLAERRAQLRALVEFGAGNWDAVCGYFGHLYPGRGIEIIEAMARVRPNCLFLVYGGNDTEVNARRASKQLANLRYLGHVPHPLAQRVMCAVDVLLMPYQDRVSIGLDGHDTAGWMSPMKMFEYLASGVPLISSDLPVLREVLRDGENALLVPASDVRDWVAALDRLVSDPTFAQALGQRGHEDYNSKHTWTRRAQRLLAAASR